ncbi:Pc16g13800 [Penicillium rubens Wisconsin 54-1255]|uniref:Transcription initiation factor IIA large subunit n=1 Tax=Penicillium rubens (strain ATCC 28089 / DSM 1075 / NRRL 1951 / Wisconsin 54-1255) TaxID=500485 RepID=B6HAS1_PENRW|nr:Pc16g13800 [Penicillium rubens Wisconsin 54-1255]
MSNQQVGAVFEKVIQEVCDASQVDFEESGVDQQTLHDLRETWQHKLSSVNVAHFPWDPAPQPPQQHSVPLPTATVPSNAPRQPPPQPQYVPPPVSMPQAGPSHTMPPMGGPRIKTEPGTNGQPGMPHMTTPMPPHGLNPQSARDRAANALQQKYGAAAANSVHQMQAQAQAGQGYPQMHPNAHAQMPQIKQEQTYPHMGPGQTDGGGDPMTDWKAEVARRRAAAENGEGDRLLREHLKQRMSQYEGGDDVKEEDEDAINSDLDDSDDLVADDHDADESEGQVMLCTYDKVQRVKNKWKCTLKDGILTTGGKEYVFHKGQGEFEW